MTRDERAYSAMLARILHDLDQEAEMKETCAFCNQPLPTPELKAGDLVETEYYPGTIAVVPDEFLTAALDARYGGPASKSNIRLVNVKTGSSFMVNRSAVKLVHGFFRITERV